MSRLSYFARCGPTEPSGLLLNSVTFMPWHRKHHSYG
jgi:hypothetical protein